MQDESIALNSKLVEEEHNLYVCNENSEPQKWRMYYYKFSFIRFQGGTTICEFMDRQNIGIRFKNSFFKSYEDHNRAHDNDDEMYIISKTRDITVNDGKMDTKYIFNNSKYKTIVM